MTLIIRICWKLDNSTYLIICTGFLTFCEVKYDIFVKKSININNHFKQPWSSLVQFFGLVVVVVWVIEYQVSFQMSCFDVEKSFDACHKTWFQFSPELYFFVLYPVRINTFSLHVKCLLWHDIIYVQEIN